MNPVERRSKMRIPSLKTTLIMGIAFVVPVIGVATWAARTSSGDAAFYTKSAGRLLKSGDLRSAEIQLRNAVQRAPDDTASRLQLAELYLLSGNSLAAEAELIVARRLERNSDRVAKLLAEAMYRNSEYGELLRDLPAGNRAPETESLVRSFRGLAELAIGNTDSAVTMLQDAERLDPMSIPPKVALARLLLSTQRIDAAEEKVKEALAISPKNSQALAADGLVLAFRGDYPAALARFNEAVVEDPANMQALIDRANFHIGRNDLEAAQRDIQTVKSASPGHLMAAYLAALIATRRGQFASADAELTPIRSVMDKFPESYFLAGFVKYALGQPGQAQTYLTRYVASQANLPNANVARAHVLLGALALNQGNPDRAVVLLDEALKLSPQNGDAIALLGQAYLTKGETDRALTLLDQAVKEQPNNADLRTRLALSRFGAGETGTALSQLADVLKSDGGDRVAGPALIIAALRASDTEQAASTAEALLKQNPDNTLYKELLATVRVAQNDLPAAEMLFTEILNSRQNVPATRRNLARVYVLMDRLSDAKRVFQEAIDQNPKDVESLRGLASAYAGEGDIDNAVALLGRARQAEPNDPGPLLQLATLYQGQKKWPEAIREGRTLITEFSTNSEAWGTLGRIYLGSADVASAVTTYRDAVRANPESSALHAAYAGALAVSKNFDGAVEAMRRAASLEPRNDDLKRAIVNLSYEGKGPVAALAAARTIARTNLDSPIGDLLVAELMVRDGQAAEAISLLERTYEKKTTLPVLLNLTELYERNGAHNRAIAELEKWTKVRPSDIDPRLKLAQIHTQARNYRAATEQFEWLVKQRPTDPVMLNNLAWAYGRTGDPRARATAENAYRRAPGLPMISDTLGWILTAQDNAEEAMKYLQTALREIPGDPDVQFHYALGLSKTQKTADARTMLLKLLASNADFDSKPDAKQLLDRLEASPNRLRQ
jgi:putative PEP-CTERM system TPR-repeat lipoprotein